jgi:hypothetical protein
MTTLLQNDKNGNREKLLDLIGYAYGGGYGYGLLGHRILRCGKSKRLLLSTEKLTFFFYATRLSKAEAHYLIKLICN